MTAEAYAQQNHPFHVGRCGAAFNGFSGPPLPFKLAGLGIAFLIARPLGFALLAFMLFKAARRRWGFGRMGAGPGFALRRPSGNSAMDEKRRATLEALAEEEKAFTEFERRQREAREREEFDRFVAERKTPKGEA